MEKFDGEAGITPHVHVLRPTGHCVAMLNGFQAQIFLCLEKLVANFSINLNTLINVQSRHILSDFNASVPKLSPPLPARSTIHKTVVPLGYP